MGVTITAHVSNTFGLPGSFSALLFIFALYYLIFFLTCIFSLFSETRWHKALAFYVEGLRVETSWF
jgi:hypothetical protein